MVWWEDLMIWVAGDKKRNKLEMAQKIETIILGMPEFLQLLIKNTNSMLHAWPS